MLVIIRAFVQFDERDDGDSFRSPAAGDD